MNNNNCSDCTYLNTNDPNDNKEYWCEKRLERRSAKCAKCDRFTEAYRRSNTERQSYEDFSNSNSSSPCFLTTMICRLLNYEDDNIYLNTMRSLRSDVLQKNEKYKPLLVEYDIVGPIIAKRMYECYLNVPFDTIKLVKLYFENFIKPICNLIDSKKYIQAINQYKVMVLELESIFSINQTITTLECENADINKSGHGVYVKK